MARTFTGLTSATRIFVVLMLFFGLLAFLNSHKRSNAKILASEFYQLLVEENELSKKENLQDDEKSQKNKKEIRVLRAKQSKLSKVQKKIFSVELRRLLKEKPITEHIIIYY
jgi:hypothetical protein